MAVVEGRVRVEPEQPALARRLLQLSRVVPTPEPIKLAAGEQTTVNHDWQAIPAAVEMPEPSSAVAWQSGQLSFQGERLRYVLEDVNRYAAKRIVVQDADVGDLLITGTVMSDNVPAWLRSLESTFDLQTVEEKDVVRIRRR